MYRNCPSYHLDRSSVGVAILLIKTFIHPRFLARLDCSFGSPKRSLKYKSLYYGYESIFNSRVPKYSYVQRLRAWMKPWVQVKHITILRLQGMSVWKLCTECTKVFIVTRQCEERVGSRMDKVNRGLRYYPDDKGQFLYIHYVNCKRISFPWLSRL